MWCGPAFATRVNSALANPALANILSITVEEGVNGPVLDRVELRGAELLVVE